MNHHQVVRKLFTEHFGDKPVIGIEIGTKCADLTNAIIETLPNLVKLYTIDPWVHVDKAEFEAGELQPYHDANMGMALKRLEKPIKDGIVEILRMTSVQAFHARFNDGIKVDFVWIDGDHSEKGITNDLDYYEQLVKSNGIFGGHDYGQCHPLTEIIKNRFGDKIIESDDFTWWILK